MRAAPSLRRRSLHLSVELRLQRMESDEGLLALALKVFYLFGPMDRRFVSKWWCVPETCSPEHASTLDSYLQLKLLTLPLKGLPLLGLILAPLLHRIQLLLFCPDLCPELLLLGDVPLQLITPLAVVVTAWGDKAPT